MRLGPAYVSARNTSSRSRGATCHARRRERRRARRACLRRRRGRRSAARSDRTRARRRRSGGSTGTASARRARARADAAPTSRVCRRSRPSNGSSASRTGAASAGRSRAARACAGPWTACRCRQSSSGARSRRRIDLVAHGRSSRRRSRRRSRAPSGRTATATARSRRAGRTGWPIVRRARAGGPDAGSTFIGRQVAGNAFEQRRLARAVRADEAENLALPDRKRHVGQRRQAAVPLGEVTHGHECIRGGKTVGHEGGEEEYNEPGADVRGGDVFDTVLHYLAKRTMSQFVNRHRVFH